MSDFDVSPQDVVDIIVFNEGSVIGFKPIHPEARELLEESFDPEFWMGDIAWGDHRPCANFIEALILDEGMVLGMYDSEGVLRLLELEGS